MDISADLFLFKVMFKRCKLTNSVNQKDTRENI